MLRNRNDVPNTWNDTAQAPFVFKPDGPGRVVTEASSQTIKYTQHDIYNSLSLSLSLCMSVHIYVCLGTCANMYMCENIHASIILYSFHMDMQHAS